MESQNGLKSMFFRNCTLQIVLGAYLRGECTTPDVYTCDCAGLVVIHSLRLALGSLKEEERSMNNVRGRRF